MHCRPAGLGHGAWVLAHGRQALQVPAPRRARGHDLGREMLDFARLLMAVDVAGGYSWLSHSESALSVGIIVSCLGRLPSWDSCADPRDHQSRRRHWGTSVYPGSESIAQVRNLVCMIRWRLCGDQLCAMLVSQLCCIHEDCRIHGNGKPVVLLTALWCVRKVLSVEEWP